LFCENNEQTDENKAASVDSNNPPG
jgi:hypothetical protein